MNGRRYGTSSRRIWLSLRALATLAAVSGIGSGESGDCGSTDAAGGVFIAA